MIQFWHHLLHQPDFWGIVSIPFVAAVVTWIHVWLAMKMVFYPIEFMGYRPFYLGWQGIIPRKAGRMAGIIVDNALEKLGSVETFFRECQPEEVAQHIARYVIDNAEGIADEVMQQHGRVLWENLPREARQIVVRALQKHATEVSVSILRELEENVSQYIELRQMVVRRMTEDKSLVVAMFQEVGHKEIAFIIQSSFWIGLILGFVQMVLWIVLPYGWGLPIYGTALGYLTNWIALTLVFEPVHPVRIGWGRCSVTFQGLFLRRQEEVSDQFAEMTAREVLSIHNFMYEMFYGPRQERTRALIQRHIKPLLESLAVRGAALLTMGPRAYADLKMNLVDRVVEASLRPLQDPELNRVHGVMLKKSLSTRMRQMSSKEFQGLLRPAFQEDEWILIAMGAVMGFIAGCVQLWLGFH